MGVSTDLYRLSKEQFARVRVEMQMMRCLEPMTAIIARPRMVDVTFADIFRPVWRN
jgi:hypothetical protein